jgi:rhomboid protease GluP
MDDGDAPPPSADPPPKEAEVTPWFAGRAEERPPSPQGYDGNPPWPVGAEPRITFGQALHFATPRVRATWLLLAANVAVFFWMVTMRGVDARDPTPEQLLENGADSAWLVLARGQWWRLFTSTFVHVGVLHLGMNMYGLYALGPFVERLYGNLGFLAIWLVAGLVGSLASVVMHPEVAASAGASGSLFGVLGALAAYLIRQRRTIPPGVFGSLMRSVLLMVALNVWLGLSVPNIDMAAHGGGAGAGFLAGFALARPLTPRGVAGRGVRALLVAVAGVVAAAGVLLARSR